MNKSMWLGVALGAAVAMAGGVVAGYKLLGDDSPASAAPAAAVVTERCTERTITHPGELKDEHRIAGSVVGGVVGGAVGKDVGDRDLTTAAGAAAGAIAGNQIQKKIQERKSYTTTVTDCVPVRP